jgi:hypothetical protein
MTTERKTRTTDDNLSEWLRRGDPMSEGLLPDEDVRRLRARVLMAAPDRRAQRQAFGVPFARPALVGGLVVILVVSAASIVWLSRSQTGTVQSAGTIRPDAVLRRPVAPTPPVPLAANQATAPREADQGRPEQSRRAAGSVSPRATSTEHTGHTGRTNGTTNGDPRRPLQVQFTTPGGTRIVWVLNPDLALQPMQQEE